MFFFSNIHHRTHNKSLQYREGICYILQYFLMPTLLFRVSSIPIVIGLRKFVLSYFMCVLIVAIVFGDYCCTVN